MPVAIGGRGDEGGANVLQEKAGGKAGSVAVEAHGGLAAQHSRCSRFLASISLHPLYDLCRCPSFVITADQIPHAS